jgi:hypothetical protein
MKKKKENSMKKKIREYFQIWQDSQINWKHGHEKDVTNFAVVMGLVISPIAIVLWLMSLILSPIARWLEKD